MITSHVNKEMVFSETWNDFYNVMQDSRFLIHSSIQPQIQKQKVNK